MPVVIMCSPIKLLTTNHIGDAHALVGVFLTGGTTAAGAGRHRVAFAHSMDGVSEGVVVAFDFVQVGADIGRCDPIELAEELAHSHADPSLAEEVERGRFLGVGGGCLLGRVGGGGCLVRWGWGGLGGRRCLGCLDCLGGGFGCGSCFRGSGGDGRVGGVGLGIRGWGGGRW